MRRHPVVFVSVVTAALFLFLTLFHIHGFSLPMWHVLIDDSRPSEILVGSARGVRTDDWATMLPLAFAQDAQQPRFPERSELVGYGNADTRIGHPVPVRNWVVAFRPQVWGYFVGRDFGLAWHWWFRVLALFLASFLFFHLLSGRRTWIAVSLALALVFAPFFQFWCFSVEPLLAMALLSFVALLALFRAASTRGIVLASVLLAWSSGCFALSVIYPPFQIPFAWLLVFAGAGWWYAERGSLRSSGRLRARLLAGGAALALAGLSALAFVVQNRETIRILSATVYPGQRFSSGGDLPLTQLLNSFFTPFLGASWAAVFSNFSESGSFLFFFPVVALVSGWEWIRDGRRPHAVSLALAAFWMLAFVYAVIGAPEFLARALLGGRVPGYRMIPALGLADVATLAVFLATPARERARRLVPATCAGVWVAALAVVGLTIAKRAAGASALGPIVVACVLLAVAVPIALRLRVAAVTLAALSIAATAWFNPVVRGGAPFLTSNPLSQRILALDREGGGDTRWVVFENTLLPDLFRAIGVRAINGLHYYPQFELWSRLGLLGRSPEYERIYNRYAHVSFHVGEPGRGAGVNLANIDWIQVTIHPDHAAFARLELDYVLYVGPDHTALDGARRLRFVESVGDKHIFRVLR